MGENHILLGDFNSHNEIWGSETTDNKGLIISNFISNTDNVLLNTGEPTHVDSTTNKMSAIDLSIASPRLSLDIEWNTYTDTLGSDHFPIIIKLGAANFVDSHFSPLCPFKTKNVNWDAYTAIEMNVTGLNANEKCSSIKNFILEAADSTLPRVTPHAPRILVPWWTPECRQAITLRNRASRNYYNHPTIDNHVVFKQYRALARRVIKTAKQNSWRDFISKITKDTPVRDIWNFIKRIKGKNHSKPFYISANGNITDDPKEIADKIAEYFASVSSDNNYSNIFIEHRRITETEINFDTEGYANYNENFTMGELLYVLGKVRGSSAGPDGIKYEMIQHMSPTNKLKLLDFYNFLWESHSFPDEWSHAITIPVHKPGKDLKSASSYRPIALTNVLCKVMERLVNRRLCKYLEKNNLLHPMQFGFRTNRSTIHNLLFLEHDIKKSLAHDNFTIAVFLDIEKAFDMAPRWGILSKMHDMGLRGNLPKFIQNFINIRHFRVKVGNQLSDSYIQQNGVPQGSVLSPTLFLIMINDILQNPPPGIKISLFADDVVIWISSFYLRTCLTRLQLALNMLQAWSDLWGLRFSSEKTKAIIFMRPNMPNKLRYRDHERILKINEVNIEMVTHHKYLGMYFDRSMTWKCHITELKLSLVNKINIIKAISGVSWGADRHTILMLYKNMIRPKLAYGCILYSSAAITNRKLLIAEQNKCLKIATGAVKCTETPILEVEAQIYPLDYFYDRVMLLTAASILNVYDHPLRTILLEYNRFIGSNYQPFCTRTHIAAIKYEIPLNEVVSTPPIDQDLWNVKRTCIALNSHIHKSDCPLYLLIEANIIVDNYPGLEHFYTDGSKKELKCGAGVSSNRYNGGWRLPDNFSVFDAELYAIFSTMEYICQHRLPSVIFTDSQSALNSIISGVSKHPLALRICHMILNSNHRIYLAWIPSHIGLPGNEKADTWARRSLDYRQSNRCPISPDTFKRIVDASLLHHWKQKWATMNFRNKFRTEIVKYYTENRINRREEVILCRLRTDATMLTHMIPKIYNNYVPICEHCNEQETVPHILIDCLKYYRERRELQAYFTSINKRMTASELLKDDPNVIKRLMKYLKDTDLISLL